MTTIKKQAASSVSSRIQNPELVRKKQLLIARKAAKLFIRNGYDNTSMREISKATKIATGNLYDYIEKKEDVLSLVFEVYHRNLEDSSFFGRINYEEDDPVEGLKHFLLSSLQMTQTFRNEIVLMYRESKRLSRKVLKEAKERELRQIRTLEVFLQKGIDQGSFRNCDPFFTANMIFFQLTTGALRGWSFKDKYSTDELHDLIVEYVMSSIVK